MAVVEKSNNVYRAVCFEGNSAAFIIISPPLVADTPRRATGLPDQNQSSLNAAVSPVYQKE